MPATLGDRMASMIGDGKTVQEAQAARRGAESDAIWGNGFISPDNFFKEIYLSLSRESISKIPGKAILWFRFISAMVGIEPQVWQTVQLARDFLLRRMNSGALDQAT
jgi:hypothetical protein